MEPVDIRVYGSKYGIPLLIGTAVFLIVLNMQEIHEIRSSGMQQQTSIRPTSDHR